MPPANKSSNGHEEQGAGPTGPTLVHCQAWDPYIPEGDLRMTPEQIRDLALTLYTFIFESGDRVAPKPMRDRCIRTCQKRGLDPTAAVMISEALTGYVYSGSSRGAHLVTCAPKAQAVLHLAMGGHEGAVGHSHPVGARLAPYAIAEMIGWVLTVSVDKQP